MARIEVPIVVLSTTTSLPVNGAAVAISFRATGAPATWWTSESGGTPSTASVISDANGRVTAWVDRGAYNLAVSGTGLTPYTEAWDAVPGGDGSLDTLWIADGAVTNQKLASGIDASKLTTGTLPAARLGSLGVGTSQIADSAITLSKIAGGVGGRIIGATGFPGFTLGSNGNVQLANIATTHSNRGGYVVVVGAALNVGGAAGACAHRVYLDGVAWNVATALPNAGRLATLNGIWSYGALSGVHNWSVNAELGNNPTNIDNAGPGVMIVFEQY